jgi:hypothetical protein
MTATSIAPSRHEATTVAVAPRSVRWALARVEGRHLLKHPVFGVGMAIAAVPLGLAGARIPVLAVDRTDTVSFLAGDCFAMLGGGAIWTFLVAYLAVSRERRDEAQDFYVAAPVTPRLRTEAALMSLGYLGLAGAALIAVAAVLLVGFDGAIVYEGKHYAVSPVDLAQGPLYLVLAGAFGVLVGTWTGHVYAAVFGAVVLFLPPVGLLSSVVFDDGISSGYYGAAMAGTGAGRHLMGIAALAALAAAGALARHDRRPRVALLALAGLGVAVIALRLPPGAGPPPGVHP